MRKHEISASIELNFYDESILLLGAHEKDQVNKWLVHIQKTKKFVDWYLSVKSIVNGNTGEKTNRLSDKLVSKLQ